MIRSINSVAIIGVGRMGIRHALGALDAKNINKILLVDISEEALSNAENQLNQHPNFKILNYRLADNLKEIESDIVIISATASARNTSCKLALGLNPEFILIEKPLGQSIKEVKNLKTVFRNFSGKVFVNLNTRMYPFIRKIKSDINNSPQFKGPININFTGGALGIGANGIHYLDLLFFLYSTTKAKIAYATIEPETIQSGRGPNFKDFGGLIVLEFEDESGKYLGRGTLSLSSTSSVFGGWEIIGSNGRIRINELENQRVDIIRDEKSKLPISRYAADYLPPVIQEIESPLLNKLTTIWLEGLFEGKSELPLLIDSFKVHDLMFEWLNKSTEYKNNFPIT